MGISSFGRDIIIVIIVIIVLIIVIILEYSTLIEIVTRNCSGVVAY